ncbi:putative retrotransposon hot spot (RHS) protein [Trypanosoma conorhini]|uniref:Putative retrotransposon hot spot (RHS) protein n=1 Tax=Trypanosoma conorhini TaxID=83891 RepID=A0A422MQJ7_9TRYP|nr:putative retrotransposon hot spot (RHS) protein [Trypanosoma conorhini]RNE95474.1 putative retrotransposon hot spot (RHS) protein [Trypanosoma conorhini]
MAASAAVFLRLPPLLRGGAGVADGLGRPGRVVWHARRSKLRACAAWLDRDVRDREVGGGRRLPPLPAAAPRRRATPAVAYFVGGQCFLFDKATKTMSRLPRLGSSAESFLQVATRTRGYIICDVMWGKRQALSVQLPPAGRSMPAVPPPEETRYREWEDETGARRVIMDCPDERDVWAMRAWPMRERPAEEQVKYWEGV